MGKHFKNITSAMAILRPFDRIVGTLSNKYAIVELALETPAGMPQKYHQDLQLMYVDKDRIFTICPMYMLQPEIRKANLLPNVQRVVIDKIIQGRRVAVKKYQDNRRRKQIFRKIHMLIAIGVSMICPN